MKIFFRILLLLLLTPFLAADNLTLLQDINTDLMFLQPKVDAYHQFLTEVSELQLKNGRGSPEYQVCQKKGLTIIEDIKYIIASLQKEIGAINPSDGLKMPAPGKDGKPVPAYKNGFALLDAAIQKAIAFARELGAVDYPDYANAAMNNIARDMREMVDRLSVLKRDMVIHFAS